MAMVAIGVIALLATGAAVLVVAPGSRATHLASRTPRTLLTDVVGAAATTPTTFAPTPAPTIPTTTTPPTTTVVTAPLPTTTAAPQAVVVTHAIPATLVLFDPIAGVNGTWVAGKACQGLRTASDIGPTTVATVKDGTGKLLSSVPLGAGTVAPASKTRGSAMTCVFHFTFPEVAGATSYVFEVAQRGRIPVSAAGMQAAGWTLALSLR